MTWWSPFASRAKQTDRDFDVDTLPMGNWQVVRREVGFACWQDAAGDVVSLTWSPLPVPSFTDALSLQRYCRDMAESQRSGLVEAATRHGVGGQCLTYIYKRLEIPAFKFFGVVATSALNGRWVWMVVAQERGVTGVREAIVAARLIETGTLTLESYESSWARDPYEPEYDGVDRSTLRYLSDDVEYDAVFPDHPLTKTRREVERLTTLRLPSAPAA